MNGILTIKGSMTRRSTIEFWSRSPTAMPWSRTTACRCATRAAEQLHFDQADLFAGDDKINIDHGLPRATLIGNAGNDTLEGGDGDDELYGDVWGDEADVFSNAVGNDNLRGHGGSDRMVGGPAPTRLTAATEPARMSPTTRGVSMRSMSLSTLFRMMVRPANRIWS